MSHSDRPLVVIGVGNVLRTDDAVGVRVIEALRDLASLDPCALPAGSRLVDGGMLGLDLLRELADARGVVLVDAVRLGRPVGSVSVLRGDAIGDACATRDGGPANAIGELLAVGRLLGWLPDPVALVAVEVADLELDVRLTPGVAAAVPIAVDAVRDELHRIDMRAAGDPRPVGVLHGGVATAALAGATA